MKLKKYEKTSLITLTSILTVIISITFLIFLFLKKEFYYIKVNGIIYNTDTIIALIDNNTKRIIYKNNILYIEDKKYSYKIEEEQEIKKNKLFEVKLKFKFKKKYNQNDLIEIVLMNKKESIISIIKKIWKG